MFHQHKGKCREVQLKIFLNEDFSKFLGSSVGVHGIFLYVDGTFLKWYRCVPIGHGTGFPKRPYFWDSVEMAGSYRLFTDMARRSGSFFVHRTVMGISGPVRRMAVAPRHLGRISKVRTFWKASSMVYRHTPISFRKGFINIKKYSVNSNWRFF